MFVDEQDYEKTLEYYNTAIEAGDPNGYSKRFFRGTLVLFYRIHPRY